MVLALIPTAIVFAIVVSDEKRVGDFGMTMIGVHCILVVGRSGMPGWKFWMVYGAATLEYVALCKLFCRIMYKDDEVSEAKHEDIVLVNDQDDIDV